MGKPPTTIVTQSPKVSKPVLQHQGAPLGYREPKTPKLIVFILW